MELANDARHAMVRGAAANSKEIEKHHFEYEQLSQEWLGQD